MTPAPLTRGLARALEQRCRCGLCGTDLEVGSRLWGEGGPGVALVVFVVVVSLLRVTWSFLVEASVLLMAVSRPDFCGCGSCMSQCLQWVPERVLRA